MKRIASVFILTLITYSLTFAQITMDEFKKQFKGKSLDEVKTMLIDQNKQLEGMIKLSSLRIKITPGKPSAGETKTTEKFSSSPKDQITKAFNDKLDKTYFAQKVAYPNTIIGLDYSARSLMYRVDNYDDYQFPEPTLKLKKIYFKNGKTLNLNLDIGGRDSEKVDEISGTKWIDSLLLEASYFYPEKMRFVSLDAKNTTQALDNGKINLMEIKENEVELQLSATVKDQIIKVEGINANGKSVEQSGSSSSSMSGNYSTAFLQEMYDASENVVAKIDQKAYKNVDELIKDLYQKMPQADKEKPENLTRASYSFRGNITGVNIFFKPKGEINNYSFTLKNKADYIDGFTIAENNKGLSGLLDENGKWVVEPTFEELDLYKGQYFMGDVAKDGYRSIYWLDRTNKKLIPFKYRFYRSEPFFDKYYSIENGINGPKGLVNAENNKIEIEPINENIYTSGNFIILATPDNKKVLLDKDLKQVMDLGDHNHQIKDDFIFVEKPYKSKEKFADYITLSNTDDIYNSAGQKINKEDYVVDTYDSFGKDGLLLVKTKTGESLYINSKGEVALKTNKYASVKNFSNGLAPVKNAAGDWGYMNTKGELVIPFLYDEAQTFSKISAMVKTAAGYMLIDRKNKPIKKFADGFSSYRTSKDADTLEYTNYDGETYGSDGQVIKK